MESKIFNKKHGGQAPDPRPTGAYSAQSGARRDMQKPHTRHLHLHGRVPVSLLRAHIQKTQKSNEARMDVALRKSGTGRFIPKLVSPPMMERDEKTILRSSIGSRPPICVRRCYSCEQCEAIQVPTGIKANSYSSSAASASGLMSDINVAYARGDHVSNYKPMSWKCKCGTSIFNP
ncbi:hypothetical protein Dimus_017583 [Dionaea muscipula]